MGVSHRRLHNLHTNLEKFQRDPHANLSVEPHLHPHRRRICVLPQPMTICCKRGNAVAIAVVALYSSLSPDGTNESS
jgi:hypothetical protein